MKQKYHTIVNAYSKFSIVLMRSQFYAEESMYDNAHDKPS